MFFQLIAVFLFFLLGWVVVFLWGRQAFPGNRAFAEKGADAAAGHQINHGQANGGGRVLWHASGEFPRLVISSVCKFLVLTAVPSNRDRFRVD